MIEYLTVFEAHRTDEVKQSILIRASTIGMARLAARKVFGVGVSFSVRTTTKEEVTQAGENEILDAEGE